MENRKMGFQSRTRQKIADLLPDIQQRLQFAAQIRIAGTRFRKKGRAFTGRAIEQAIIELLDLLPARGVHVLTIAQTASENNSSSSAGPASVSATRKQST